MENSPSPQTEGAPLGTSGQAVAQRDRTIALVCAALLLIGMPVGWLPGSTGDVVGLIVISLVCLALMGWIVLWLVPRERAAARERASRTALILGVLAILSCLVFWTGLPFPIGAGAIALGLWLRESGPAEGRGRATASVALGALAVVAAFVVLLIG